MTSGDTGKALKVGLLILFALVSLAAAIFLIGEERNLFKDQNDYYARFLSVGGLNPGNPVQLNGVKVGSIQRVILPRDPEESRIRVELSIDERYAERLREDSTARIQSLGLLGDKYVEISSGSAASPIIPPGSEIPVDEPPGMSALMASGEDVIANVTEISAVLRVILKRIEAGEGMVGELVSDREAGARITTNLLETMDSIQQVADRIENGEGVIPRLITDREMAQRLERTLASSEALMASMEEGEGLVPALMNDRETRQRFESTLASLETSATNLASFTDELKAGEGVLPKLFFDEEYGREVTGEISELVDRLNRIAEKIDRGDGTAGALINDPEIYNAVNDIVVGINESRMLRWLIRNRQKKGIEKRYEGAVGGEEPEMEEGDAPEPPAPDEPGEAGSDEVDGDEMGGQEMGIASGQPLPTPDSPGEP